MKFFLVTCLAVAASAANIPLHGEGKITGGEDALDGEFPWMVSLRSVGWVTQHTLFYIFDKSEFLVLHISVEAP